MSKVYLFAVMLLAASFTGCIEGGDLEESTTTEEEVEETEEEERAPGGASRSEETEPLCAVCER